MKRYDVFAVYDKASWVAGESINLNGTPYPVAYDEDAYYLNTGSDDIPASLLAVYPSDTDAEGNDVTVTNNGTTGTKAPTSATAGSSPLLTAIFRKRIFPYFRKRIFPYFRKRIFPLISGKVKLWVFVV